MTIQPKDPLDLWSLAVFAEVARLRSFSQAALALGVTQSAASQRVMAMERKLGVSLVDRTVRPLALTEAGKRLQRGGRELLQRYEQLERELRQMGQALTGRLSVVAIYSAGIDLLDRLTEAFTDAHPAVRVEVEYLRPDAAHDRVRRGEADLGIVSYPRSWKGVGVIPLREERMVVVCAAGHDLARHRRARPRDLTEYPFAAIDHELPMGRQVRRYLRDHDAEVRISNDFDNIDTIKSAVAGTEMVSILPRRTVLREVAAGTLFMLELEPPITRPIGIIHPREADELSPPARAFVDYLLTHAGPHVDLGADLLPAPSPASPASPLALSGAGS